MREVNSFDLEGYDTIIYLAAISNDPMGNTFSEQTFDINYHSTIDIAKKAKNNGIKILFLHQVVVYMELQMENEMKLHPLIL